MIIGEPEYVGKFPIRQDIPVLPHSDPNRKVGWYCRTRSIPPDDPLWKDPNFLGGEIVEISRDPFENKGMNSLLDSRKIWLLREIKQEIYHIGVCGTKPLCGYEGETRGYHNSYNIFKVCKECSERALQRNLE